MRVPGRFSPASQGRGAIPASREALRLRGHARAGRRVAWLLGIGPRFVFALGCAAGSVAAQPLGIESEASVPLPEADRGQTATPGVEAIPSDEKLVWQNTVLSWTQSASGQTVGVGQDYQSRNPEYEWTFAFKPRLYLYEEDPHQWSIRGDIGVFREFTNSDSTTRRGEWSFTDAELMSAYVLRLYERESYVTSAGLLAPVLTFPTSKVSANNGSILRLGASAQVRQQVPLLGEASDVLKTASGSVSVGYARSFTESTVAVSPDLQRTRLDPQGRAIPSDQLSGAPLARDQLTFGVEAGLGLTERIQFGTAFAWRAVYKYPVTETEICTVVQPGCVEPRSIDEPQEFAVITLFSAEVGVKVLDELSIAFGYANLALQLGPDGQRRNIFYSPDARLFLSAIAHLDAIYDTATGKERRREASASRPASAVW